MKHWARFALVLVISSAFASGLSALPAAHGGGGGGGHGGSGGHGGHGGFHSGGSSHGGVGHAIGHSFGHLFGHHSKTPATARDVEPPLAGAALVNGKIVQLPGPRRVPFTSSPRFPHRRFHEFHSGERFFFFPPGFGFGNCGGFGFPFDPLFFNDRFDCFGGALLFDPFFFGNFSGSFADTQALFSDPAFASSMDSAGDVPDFAPDDSAALSEEASNSSSNRAAAPGIPPDLRPVTLMQLRDGTMYGLTDYWLEDSRLHYTTTYGGQDTIALDRVDLEKTAELNAGRGIEFAPKPRAH